ncbi:unnamed protein product [Gongylonema pulchrum]|uniref:Uncharacterized protein n=1 Tax=Gongylonema pulchrum TaxID=637853 RepID=A0A183CW46_9BILA|nr:unnamed protein product [Gongylonema pulchrum]
MRSTIKASDCSERADLYKTGLVERSLFENHVDPDGYHRGENAEGDSSDGSLDTAELLELSFSSVGTSVLSSNDSLHSSEVEDEEPDLEEGERIMYSHGAGDTTEEKDE